MNWSNPKTGILRDKVYLDKIRSQSIPCAVTGLYGSEGDQVVPAHVGITGKGCKAPDNHVLPMLDSEHMASHGQRGGGGVQSYWCGVFMNDRRLLLDVLAAYAEKLYVDNKD